MPSRRQAGPATLPAMLDFDVLRVFAGDGDDDGAGRAVAVFMRGDEVGPAQRGRIAASLGVDVTAFVDDRLRGCVETFVSSGHVPLRCDALVGTAWLLHASGFSVDSVRPPAGRIAAWQRGGSTWIRVGGARLPRPAAVELGSPSAVDGATPASNAPASTYVWAWEGQEAVRSRLVSSNPAGDPEEPSVVAACALSATGARALTVRHGDELVIEARHGLQGSVELGGRVAIAAARDCEPPC